MRRKKVIIIRGASGSGKSTVAKLFGGNVVICTADDYFYEDGIYKFNPDKLAKAHEACYQKFVDALEDSETDTVVVANTNTKESDFLKYIDTAKEYGSMVFSLVVENRHGNTNVHDVPDHILDRQVSNIKNTLKLR